MGVRSYGHTTAAKTDLRIQDATAAAPNNILVMSKPKRVRRKIESPFARILTQVLKDRGITQRQAAALCSVAPSVINQWTSGSQPLDLGAVLTLSKALGISFQFLLTGEEPGPAPKPVAEIPLDELFEESPTEFSGIYRIEAKRLRRKGSPPK